jgi:hypothetical protein
MIENMKFCFAEIIFMIQQLNLTEISDELEDKKPSLNVKDPHITEYRKYQF